MSAARSWGTGRTGRGFPPGRLLRQGAGDPGLAYAGGASDQEVEMLGHPAAGGQGLHQAPTEAPGVR